MAVPIQLEIFMKDLTKTGLVSVAKNVEGAEQETLSLIKALQEVRAEYVRALNANKEAGKSYQQEAAMVQALTGQIKGLKEGLKELQKAKQQTSETPVVSPNTTVDMDDVSRKANNLRMQFSQVARELPSLAMGPQMFILAISNNLPMLTDAIADVRKQNELLKASGKSAVPVWKQLMSALFSGQTALVALISIGVLFGNNIADLTKKLFKGKEASLSYADVQKKVADSLKENSGSLGEQIVKVRSLSERWKELGDDMDAKKKFIKENREELDSLGTSVNNVSDAENLLVTNTESYITAMSLRAQASAALKLASDEATKSVQKQMEIEREKQNGPSFWDKVRATLAASAPGTVMPTSAQTNVTAEEVQQGRIDGLEEEKQAADETEAAYRKLFTTLTQQAKEALKAAGIDLSGNDDDENKHPRKDYATELAEARLRAEQTVERLRIQLMQEGIDKRKALARQEYDEQMSDIDRQEQEMLAKMDAARKQGDTVTDSQYEQVRQNANQQRILQQQVLNQRLTDIDREYQEQAIEAQIAYNKQYGTYAEQRAAIIAEGMRKAAKAETDGARNMIIRQMEDELKNLDFSVIKKNINWDLIFGNLSEITTKKLNYLKENIKKFKESTEYELLSIDQIKVVEEAITKIQDELDRRISYPFNGFVKGIQKLKEASELTKKALQETNEEKKKLLQSQSEAEYGKGVRYLKEGALEASDAVGFLAEQVSILAEATGDAKFKEFSDQFSAFSQNLQSAGQGAQSGGWIGAIVGGASDMINQTVASMAQLQVEANEYEQNRIDFLRELEKKSLSLKNEDYDSIFGISSIEKAREAYMLALEALEKYNEALEKTSGIDIEKEYKNLGAAIFAPIFGSFGFGKRISEETKALMEAYEKGYTDLQAMAVKTKDRSGWANFWGKKDEYTALKDLAPELWNEDGTFNVEAAQAFLDTNTQISDEQRKQIQNVIDLKNAYDENIAIIDELLASTFGSLGSDITDIIFDSVRNGTDAWEQFREVGSGVIDELGKQMIQELYVQTYLETFKERMRAAYGLDSVEDTQKELANIMNDIYNGLGTVFAGASSAAEEWDKWAESHGFTPGAESGSGDVSSTIDGLDELQKAYEKLSEQVSKAYSNESVRILQQQNENLREQARLIQERIDSGMSSEDLIEQLDDINAQILENEEAMKDAIFGEDIQSAISNFVSTYTEALGNGGSMQRMSKDFIESMIQNMVKESMKADTSPVMDNIRKKLIEAWKDGVVTADEQLSIEEIVNNLNKELSDKYGWAESLFGESDIEGLEDLQNAYDRLSDSVSEAYSSNKAELLRQQNEILRQQRDLIQERLEAEKALGERGDSSLVNEWEEQLEEVNNQIEENKKAQLDAIFGQDTQTQISNLASALIDVWSGAKKQADSAKDFINNIIRSMVQESLMLDLTPFIDSLRKQMEEMFKDGIISADEGDILAGMVENIMNNLEKQYEWADRFMKDSEEIAQEVEEMKQSLTGLTLDSFTDSFVSGLADMSKSYKDMCDDFEDSLRNSIFKGLVESQYKNRITALYNMWERAAESEGQITDKEAEQLRYEYQQIIQDLMKQRDEMAQDFGWANTTDQSPSSGTLTTMSQDSIAAFEGIGRNMQTHLANMDRYVQELRETQRLDSETLATIASHTSYIVLIYDLMEDMKLNGIKMQ